VLQLFSEVGRHALNALQPILLFEQSFETLAISYQYVIDAETFGFVAELLPLTFEDVALAVVLLDAFVELVERSDCAFLERPERAETFELIVDLGALDPERLDADRNF
jgi:hypothetical protein